MFRKVEIISTFFFFSYDLMVIKMMEIMKRYNSFSINYYKNHLYVCNYVSIVDINEQEIIIKSDNIIKIYGSDIRAVKLLKNEALFVGIFKRIDFDE